SDASGDAHTHPGRGCGGEPHSQNGHPELEFGALTVVSAENSIRRSLGEGGSLYPPKPWRRRISLSADPWRRRIADAARRAVTRDRRTDAQRTLFGSPR